MHSIAILDYGSQYAQLIARRVREAHCYCELFPWDSPAERVLSIKPKGFILSGAPHSVYEPSAPYIPEYIFQSKLPILGICYGMQMLANQLGGKVAAATAREYGFAQIERLMSNALLPFDYQQVWMSHGDRIEELPHGFVVLARSQNSPIAAMGDLSRAYYGVQFHPEVHHTQGGQEILRRFIMDICDIAPSWTPQSIIQHSIQSIQAQVDFTDGKSPHVLVAVSGGVDSTVAAALTSKAVGDELVAVFVDTGLLRSNERQQVEEALGKHLGVKIIVRDASHQFLQALHGITSPEEKRRIIGALFIQIFEEEAKKLGNPPYLVQGTIYPDVVESSAPDRNKAARIKTHHNVGGLPAEMRFKLIEPLRYLFKDEVRLVGEALGLPSALVWRQPFPGPGLAVRCLGEVTPARLAVLRQADAIFMEELHKANLASLSFEKDALQGTSQAFVVLLPLRTVGVMGDQRTYQEVVALRAVTSDDFMTADWARLPYDFLANVANRIVNEVEGVNRVVYDITSKPPATIEWE